MPWLLLAIPLVLMVAASARRSASPSLARRPVVEDEDPLELLARNAPQALARYGTPEVAEYLREQGRGDDLHGLGYRE